MPCTFPIPDDLLTDLVHASFLCRERCRLPNRIALYILSISLPSARNELQKVQIESQKQVAQAEAENKAIKLQADAEAYRITVQAKAEADAIKLKGDALRNNKELVDLTIAEKWDGSVPQTVVASGEGGSSVVPLLNIGKSGSAQGN